LAYNRDCPKWILENKVLEIKAEKGVSFHEARRLVSSGNDGGSVSQAGSMAVVMARRPTPQPSINSVHIRTDLT